MSMIDYDAYRIVSEERDRLSALNKELADALRTWQKFFDTMPKGQFGKISCDIGLMNDGFIKTARALAKVRNET